MVSTKHLGNMINPDPDTEFLPIPDPRVQKKAPDPGSATLHVMYYIHSVLCVCVR